MLKRHVSEFAPDEKPSSQKERSKHHKFKGNRSNKGPIERQIGLDQSYWLVMPRIHRVELILRGCSMMTIILLCQRVGS